VASKYAAIIDRLQPLPPQDISYQAKVDELKLALINNDDFPKTPSGLARAYAGARAEKDRIAKEEYDINLEIEALAQMLLASQNAKEAEWGQYGAADNTLRLMSGDKIEVRREPYASCTDKEANRKWAIANGLESLLTIHHQTLNSLTNERLLKGEAEPDGVSVFMKPKIVFTRMKKGTE